MSDLVGTQIVGFLMHRFIYETKIVQTSLTEYIQQIKEVNKYRALDKNLLNTVNSDIFS